MTERQRIEKALDHLHGLMFDGRNRTATIERNMLRQEARLYRQLTELDTTDERTKR